VRKQRGREGEERRWMDENREKRGWMTKGREKGR
jgi:hypothetical protein